MKRFMLYVGSQHDEKTRAAVALECSIRGITVVSENGPLGTVVVRHDSDRQDELETIPGVTSVCAAPEGCPYGQTDCHTETGGICLCGFPLPSETFTMQLA